MWLLNHIVKVCIILWEATNCLPEGSLILHSQQQWVRVPVTKFSPTFGVVGVLDFHHSYRYVIVSCVLIYISLEDVWDWLYFIMSAICMSPFLRCSFRSFAYFNQIAFCYCWVLIVLWWACSLDNSSLSDVFANIFLPLCGSSSIFLIFSFVDQKF